MRIFNICACVLLGAFVLCGVLTLLGLYLGGYAVGFILGVAGLPLGALGGLGLGFYLFRKPS